MVKSKKRKKKQAGKKGIIKHIQIQWAKKKMHDFHTGNILFSWLW